METYIMFRIAQRVLELTPALTEKGRPPIRMSIGAPTTPPPQALLDYFKQCLDEPGAHAYSVPKGEPFFRQGVAQWMQRRFGVTVCPEQEVCSLIGSKEGLSHMFRALITPRLDVASRDIILVPDPGYASYRDSIEVSGGTAWPMPLLPENQYLPDVEAIYQDILAKGHQPEQVKAVVLCYPSNPVGAMAPFSYYEKVVAFARRHNVLVISDAAYCDLYFPGQEPPRSVLEVPGAMDIAVEFFTMSKPYSMTGWRVGFAAGNTDAITILSKVKSTVDTGIFKAIQKTAVWALNSGQCDAFIQESNAAYQEKQSRMLAGFKALGWPEETLNAPKATFYLWLPIPPRYRSCEQYCTEVLEKSGVVLVPGTAFGHSGEGFMRLSVVNPLAELDEVIQRLKTDGFGWQG